MAVAVQNDHQTVETLDPTTQVTVPLYFLLPEEHDQTVRTSVQAAMLEGKRQSVWTYRTLCTPFDGVPGQPSDLLGDGTPPFLDSAVSPPDPRAAPSIGRPARPVE